MSKINMSEEAKTAMAENGWDTGMVAFGFTVSEATVKLATGLPVAAADKQDDDDVTWVSVSFDDSPLGSTEGMGADTVTPGAKHSLGVKSELYSTITGGACAMPTLAINGQMYTESDQLLLLLAKQNKDTPKEVTDLIQLSIDHSDNNFQVLKHWGWAAFHKGSGYAMVTADHYTPYGQGASDKDDEWETNVTDKVKTFFDKLESVLAANKKEVDGFYVGDSMTLADCVLINWPQSFSGVTGLDVAKYYPKVHANFEMLKANPPGKYLGHSHHQY